MTSDTHNPNFASIDSQLSAAGLPTGNTIWVDLANAILEAYSAYENNTTPSLDGYQYVNSIWVQETLEDEDAAAVAPRTDGLLPPYQGNTLMGFAAVANDLSHNIIAFRGTVTDEEAGYDLDGWNTNTACLLPSGSQNQNSYGDVKEDLYDFYVDTDLGLYISLAASFKSAVQELAAANPNKPWMIAAHSLGGALVTLAALDAQVSASYTGSTIKPWLVTFGSLHVGVQSFADAFNQNVPSAFRFANLCDFVPSLVSLEPPTTPPPDPYVHVGLELTFVWQTWDDWGNHSMQNIYLPIVQTYMNVIHMGPRTYPQ
jgi:hypothetical protein